MAASVRDRLYILAQREKRDFALILTAFAIKRFLYRLTCSEYADRFVLKGARLFALWAGKPHRPTRDLDLLSFGDASTEALNRAFELICKAQVEPDGLTFDTTAISIEEIRLEQEYGGQCIFRARAVCESGYARAVNPGAREQRFRALASAEFGRGQAVSGNA